MTSIFDDTFEPPMMATNGRAGFAQRLAQVVQLLLHQVPGRRLGQVLGDALGAGVGPVGGAEGVVDVDSAKLASCLAKAGSFSSSAA